MYVLYYYPGNASILPHMLLNEIGAKFELRLVDRTANAQKSPEYLKLNPHGKIPVLVDEENAVLYESAAILLHLCDRHPEANLAPPTRTGLRAQFYKWAVHLTNTPQATYREYFYPGEHTTDPAGEPAVKARAEQNLNEMFDRIAEDLGDRPYLLGDHVSAVDFQLFMLIRWGRNLKRPPRSLPALGALAERMMARPAVARTFETEGLQAPLY